MQERLQKFLAAAGVASRRNAEKMMLEGRVTVNGAVVQQLGTKVDPSKDAVKVDGKRVLGEEHQYVLLFKPKGTICTLDDPEDRPTVVDLIKGAKARLFPVGRLDFDTTGALLLTNDGELANQLMHPRHRFAKTYVAKVKGIPTEERLEKLRNGVHIEGKKTAPAEVRILQVKEKNSIVEVVLREGRNKQVKRMFLAIGHAVIRLHRSAYGFLTVEGMEPGSWRFLEPEEVTRLSAAADRAATDAGPAPVKAFKRKLDRPLKSPRPSQPARQTKAPAKEDRKPAARSSARPGARKPGAKPGGKPAAKRRPG
jgi:23S rRNA pseudouridine2605 synthase